MSLNIQEFREEQAFQQEILAEERLDELELAWTMLSSALSTGNTLDWGQREKLGKACSDICGVLIEQGRIFQ